MKKCPKCKDIFSCLYVVNFTSKQVQADKNTYLTSNQSYGIIMI